MRRINMEDMPTVRMNVLLSLDGFPYVLASRASWMLDVDGRPTPVRAVCPDTSWRNSVALVLDNSGSMMGTSFTALKDAAKQLVDSLKPEDEAAVFAVNRSPGLLRDFTVSKDSLHATINAMGASGNTFLTDAILAALRAVTARGGKRSLIVFSDGFDTALLDSLPVMSALAAASDVRLFTIVYGATGNGADILWTLAKQTGGRHFQVGGASQFAIAFAAIASELNAPGCLLLWDVPGCADSLRDVRLHCLIESHGISWDSTLSFPYWRDTVRMSIYSPPRAEPGYSGISVLVAPRIDKRMDLSFRVLVRYDPALMEALPGFTLTTKDILDRASLGLRLLRPGVLECSASFAHPLREEGVLFSVQFLIPPADSSRPVILSLDSVEFASGCPNIVIATPDTVDVCQCIRDADAIIHVDSVFRSGGEGRAEIRMPTPTGTQPRLFRTVLQHDARHLEFGGVEAARDVSLSWGPHLPDALRIDGREEPRDATDQPLYTVTYRGAMLPEATRTSLRLSAATVYADCCYFLTHPAEASLDLDGYCERLLRQRAGSSINAAYPQPATGRAELSVRIDGAPGGAARPTRLALCDAFGRELLTIFDGPCAPGAHVFPIDVSALPSGVYLCTLRVNGALATRILQVLR
ncbi:MAG: VWA domain-containing protein [Ignavibacteria bacterium]|nr:VWA domain-containing protein [Ignavibacteria bacterium]